VAAESLRADRQTDRQTVTKIEGVILEGYFESVNKKYYTDGLFGSWEISRANDSVVLVCVHVVDRGCSFCSVTC
jgi:hypothetical protein